MIEYTVKVWPDGTRKWYFNGKIHREDGPAIEGHDGEKHWNRHGKLHRTDGPAIIYPSGAKEYYLNGKYLTKQEWKKRLANPSCDGKVVEVDGKKYQLKEL